MNRIPYVGCPLCASKSFVVLCDADCSHHPLWTALIPATQRWMECSECRHQFTEGYLSDEQFAMLFAKTQGVQLPPGEDPELARAAASLVVERAVNLGGGVGPWLDVAFGDGSLLATAEEYGYEVEGLDIREAPVRELQRLGFKAHCTAFEKFETDQRYGVISMADVLEHFPFPRVALSKAKELLKPGGLLFISTPNKDSLAWKLATEQRRNPYWREIEHFHNFGRKRLFHLLSDHHLQPVKFNIGRRQYRFSMDVFAQRK